MKKVSILVIVITVLLVSCKRETPVEAPSQLEEVRVPATSTCTDSASFVADVTIPDNTNLDPGKSFTKTWRVKNTGTCTWDETYSLVFALNERMDAPTAVPLEKTRPGREVEISVDLTTPTESGEYRADFQLLNADGTAMPVDNGEYLWVVITIGPAVGWADSNAAEESNTWEDGPGLTEATCEYSTDPAKTAEILEAIQAYRAQNDVPELALNAQLEQAAQAHANDMACNKIFVHTGSNGSSPGTRVSAVGYSASKVGENVYGSYLLLSGQDVVAWWAADQNDIRHNENLVNADYTEIGIGYAFFDNFGHYAVVFAVP